ncbi:MAG: ABC transporter ATP-binding protein [Robiginitomaculum sp.]|nr:MAG: ABC transporter ATP-binding protein [Robiginitomaculum sp.]
MSTPVFALQNVSKTFSGKPAVRDLSFSVKAGTITGFLGPNGAGKSTSLRIGLGILAPDSGKAELFGSRPNFSVLDRVGFLPEERGLYRKMNVLASIVFFGRLKGMSARMARKKGLALLKQFDLGDVAHKKIKTLSKGMAQKVQIIASIVHEPELVILDEPFSGLDPVNQRTLEALIRTLADQGTTILFSTHVMEHAERLCDRIVLLAAGRKIFDGNVDEALQTLPRAVLIQTGGGTDPAAALEGLVQSIAREGEAVNGRQNWRVELTAGADAQDVLRTCVEKGVSLTSFEPQKRHLHDVFVHLVDQDLSKGQM